MQVIPFCDKESTLKDTRSGFRNGQSTHTVQVSIRNGLLRAMKKKKITLMVLADFSKAFNTVHCRMLIAKLIARGFCKSFLSCLTSSYLIDPILSKLMTGYHLNLTGSARGGSGTPISLTQKNSPNYPKFFPLYPKLIEALYTL